MFLFWIPSYKEDPQKRPNEFNFNDASRLVKLPPACPYCRALGICHAQEIKQKLVNASTDSVSTFVNDDPAYGRSAL